ncbi:hypothetical protein D3C80_1796730 [compost metagenome]
MLAHLIDTLAHPGKQRRHPTRFNTFVNFINQFFCIFDLGRRDHHFNPGVIGNDRKRVITVEHVNSGDRRLSGVFDTIATH